LQLKSTMVILNIQLRNLLDLDAYDQFVGLINENPGCGAQLDSIISNDTLLHMAIKYRKLNYVRALVQNGASLNIKCGPGGFDALFEAVYQCMESCSRFWREHVDGYKERVTKEIEEYYNIIVFLLESGANPNTLDINGNPLLVMICTRRLDNRIKHIVKNIVTALIDHNIDVNVETEYSGYTIEYYCIWDHNDDLLDHIKNYRPTIIKGCHCDDNDI